MNKVKSKKILMIIVICTVFVVGIFLGRIFSKGGESVTNDSETTTQIVEVDVGTQTIENTLTGSGEISASESEKLALSTTKYFDTMCVEEGDIVDAGENILQYKDGTYLTAEYQCLINSYSVPDTGSKVTSSNYVEVKNLETMVMNLSISETEINKVEKDQEVTINLSAIDDKTYTGKIKSVSGIGTYQSSGTTFSAVVEFENDGNAKPGMSATCSIVIEQAENCVAVPIDSVQTDNDGKYVVKVNDDGTTQNVAIETGISNSSYVQVTSGLTGGEKIQMVQIVTNTSNGGSNGKDDKMDSRGEMPSGEMPSGDMQAPSGENPGGFNAGQK